LKYFFVPKIMIFRNHISHSCYHQIKTRKISIKENELSICHQNQVCRWRNVKEVAKKKIGIYEMCRTKSNECVITKIAMKISVSLLYVIGYAKSKIDFKFVIRLKDCIRTKQQWWLFSQCLYQVGDRSEFYNTNFKFTIPFFPFISLFCYIQLQLSNYLLNHSQVSLCNFKFVPNFSILN